MLPERIHLVLLLAPVLIVAAVGCDDEPADDGASVGGSSAQGGGVPDAPPASPKALVKLKNAQRFRADLALTLDLPDEDVCKELGRYDCAGLHQVVMGSADPYLNQLYEPLPATSATSPLAYERVAMAACVARVGLDFGGPDGLIFRNLPLSGGALADPADPAVSEAIRTLYRRGLTREATEGEVTALVGLYPAVATAEPGQPASAWAVASCVAVLTSLENVFY